MSVVVFSVCPGGWFIFTEWGLYILGWDTHWHKKWTTYIFSKGTLTCGPPLPYLGTVWRALALFLTWLTGQSQFNLLHPNMNFVQVHPALWIEHPDQGWHWGTPWKSGPQMPVAKEADSEFQPSSDKFCPGGTWGTWQWLSSDWNSRPWGLPTSYRWWAHPSGR